MHPTILSIGDPSLGDTRYSSRLDLFNLKGALLAKIQTRIEIGHYKDHSKDEYQENQIDPNEHI